MNWVTGIQVGTATLRTVAFSILEKPLGKWGIDGRPARRGLRRKAFIVLFISEVTIISHIIRFFNACVAENDLFALIDITINCSSKTKLASQKEETAVWQAHRN